MNYYKRLKDLREDHDKTQSEIAKIIQTTQSYYAQYENGHRPIPIDRLIILADYYKVNMRFARRTTILAAKATKTQLIRQKPTNFPMHNTPQ